MIKKTALNIIFACTAALALTGTASADNPESCKTVRFGDVGWTDIAATTATASVVLEGLGYKPETMLASVPITFVGLQKNNLDVFLGDWMPTMKRFIQPYLDDGSIEVVRPNLTGAKYTLAVPDYAAEAGLKDFADIAKFVDRLDGKVYGLEAGNDGNLVIEKMIDANAFGLGDFRLVESSEAAMLVQVGRAVRNKEWVVFLAWEPHPMNTRFDLTYLSGGDDWFGADYGGATVYTVVRKGYLQECPNVGQFLKNLEFSLKMENEIMGAILDEGEKPQQAARVWLKANPEVLNKWLEGVTAFDGGDAVAAVRNHLGL